MTTDPTPPTPETLLADALQAERMANHLAWGTDAAHARAMLLAHAPLRDALTRGLALTPERLAAALQRVTHGQGGCTVDAHRQQARDILAALTPEATDAAE